jgi:hypothetical protein
MQKEEVNSMLKEEANDMLKREEEDGMVWSTPPPTPPNFLRTLTFASSNRDCCTLVSTPDYRSDMHAE